MIKALSTSASGMRAQQIYVDTIANNLANVNTSGFKSSRAEFQDLLYQVISPNQRATRYQRRRLLPHRTGQRHLRLHARRELCPGW